MTLVLPVFSQTAADTKLRHIVLKLPIVKQNDCRRRRHSIILVSEDRNVALPWSQPDALGVVCERQIWCTSQLP